MRELQYQMCEVRKAQMAWYLNDSLYCDNGDDYYVAQMDLTTEHSKTDIKECKDSNLDNGNYMATLDNIARSKSVINYTIDANCGKTLQIDFNIEELIPVYRLVYNTFPFEHLYTASLEEYRLLHEVDSTWMRESVAWLSPKSGEKVFRLNSPGNFKLGMESHYYIPESRAEELGGLIGSNWWEYDFGGAAAFYSGGDNAVYVACSSDAMGAQHFYTATYQERWGLRVEPDSWRLEEEKNIDSQGNPKGFFKCKLAM